MPTVTTTVTSASATGTTKTVTTTEATPETASEEGFVYDGVIHSWCAPILKICIAGRQHRNQQAQGFLRLSFISFGLYRNRKRSLGLAMPSCYPQLLPCTLTSLFGASVVVVMQIFTTRPSGEAREERAQCTLCNAL